MAWSKGDIEAHVRCCNVLDKVKDEIFDYISKHHNATEYDVKEFILDKFKEYGLKTTLSPIVAFNSSAADMHYSPKKKSRKLEKNTLIMIDLWAKIGSLRTPFSDITWMAYTGKLSKEQLDVCTLVFTARDGCINYLKKQLASGKIPTGKELDAVTRKIIADKGYGKYFLHSTGHSIGFNSPHGIYGALRKTNNKSLLVNMGYTIEPGIYLKGKFGARSEIDFYITKDLKLVLTTPVQKELVKLG
jgi:Xaa-Pro aminopeptidase